MNKKILIGLGLVLFTFLCGDIIAVLYITKTTDRMENLITLHQAEILRENLIIRVEQVQSSISRHKIRSEGDIDVLISRVQDMEHVMAACGGCHHSPELTKGIMAMHDMANDYKTAINRLVTASADTTRAAALERSAQDMGQELITMTQSMAFTANNRLQQKTLESMAIVRKVRNVLYVTLAFGVMLSIVVIIAVRKSLKQRTQDLINAVKNIARGELQHQVDIGDSPDSEFRELSYALKMMTENLRRSQRHLIQNAKLSAIGELATNIAYEVSNPLASVLGHTGLLLAADDISEEKKKQLKEIETETARARGILKSLMDFSQRKPPQLAMTNILQLIEQAKELAQGLTQKGKIVLVLECPATIPSLAVDGDELRQVMVNLINNACSAMPAGGTLTIRCKTERELSGEEILVIEFVDTGEGIPEEHLDKIFDPFFTTRPGSEGAGMGLAISYMIVKNHGGRIAVDSTIGKGSMFRIILPVEKTSRG